VLINLRNGRPLLVIALLLRFAAAFDAGGACLVFAQLVELLALLANVLQPLALVLELLVVLDLLAQRLGAQLDQLEHFHFGLVFNHPLVFHRKVEDLVAGLLDIELGIQLVAGLLGLVGLLGLRLDPSSFLLDPLFVAACGSWKTSA